MQWPLDGELVYEDTRCDSDCRPSAFFVHNMVMALRAGGRTPDEIIVIDQTTPEDRNPIAFAALKDHGCVGSSSITKSAPPDPLRNLSQQAEPPLYSGSTAS